MDEMVRAALAKWPNVPDCYGWLALDTRGQWRLGAERQTITNPAMRAFIARNYTSDEEGRWMFQNGPQKVFVALDYTPWVWHTVPAAEGLALEDHTGRRVERPESAWLDEEGRFLFFCAERIGVLHDHDTASILDCLCDAHGKALNQDQLAAALERWGNDEKAALHLAWPRAGGTLTLKPIRAADVPQRFHFTADPQPA